MNTLLKKFGFEVYTLHPVTKEEGWDLKFVEVIAESKAEAKEILKGWDLFDCIILSQGVLAQDSAPYYVKGTIIELDAHFNFKGVIK